MQRDQGTQVLYNKLIGMRILDQEEIVVGYWDMEMKKKLEQQQSKKIGLSEEWL